MLKADLHLHTTCSDGRLTPGALVREAAACGLSLIAITDHDSFAGYSEARSAAREAGIQVIPGVELTTRFKDREVHLLGYFFNPDHDGLKAMIQEQQQSREKRFQRIMEKLHVLGVDIQSSDVQAEPGTVPARPHIAAALHRKGLVSSTKEAFNRYLGEGAAAYVPLLHAPIENAIAMLHAAGGVAVLAHPGRNFSDTDLESLRQSGLDGVEYLHPAHDYPLQCRYSEWASKYGLLATGGSDYHGFSSRDRQFLGVVAIDIKLVASMRQRAAAITSLTS